MSTAPDSLSPTTAWILLVVAGILEVGWAVSMKYSHGFTRLWPSLATLVLLAASMVLLAIAQRALPLGTAYAVWVGVGAFGAALLGMVLFNEPATPLRIACLVLLIAAIMGLKFGAAPEPA